MKRASHQGNVRHSIATSVPVPIAKPTLAIAQRRGIVNAISGHTDNFILHLQLGDFCFILRQDFRKIPLCPPDQLPPGQWPVISG